MFLSFALLTFALVLLMGSLGIGANGDGEVNDKPDDSHLVPEEFRLQNPALEAYSALQSIFKVDEDGGVTYPDDYAGAWIDDEFNLRIALTTSETGRDLINYEELLKEHEEIVIYEEVEFSYNELDKIRSSIFEELRKEHLVISNYVDVEKNKINFGFVEFDESRVKASIHSLISESAMVRNNLPDKDIDINLFIFSMDKEEINETE